VHIDPTPQARTSARRHGSGRALGRGGERVAIQRRGPLPVSLRADGKGEFPRPPRRMPRTMEFQSFREMVEHRHPVEKRSPNARKTSPWVPSGLSEHHLHAKGQTKLEREASLVDAARSEAAAEAASERDLLSQRLTSTEQHMGRLEASLDAVVSDVEEHIVASTAASVLVAKRLAELGL
jgi:hypothetical protein